jgi:hypothetical protein
VWIVHALMFPLYLVVATDLYVILHYHTRLSSSMLLTIFENLEDAREYAQTHYKSIAGQLALVLAGYALCMVKILGEPRPFDYDRWKLRPRASAPRPVNRALN